MSNEFRIIFPGDGLPKSVNVNGEDYVRRSDVVPPPAAPPLEVGDFVRVVLTGREGPLVGQIGCVTGTTPHRISVAFENGFGSEHPCLENDVSYARHGRWFWTYDAAWTDGAGTRIEKI